MAHFLALLLTLTQLFPLIPMPLGTPDAVTERLRSGEWLRLHVIAPDDTPDMQQLKLLVRDAVRDCYAAHRPEDASMLDAATQLLPRLTLAATESARAEGYTGEVSVTLDTHSFDDRLLAGMTIPAGEYPALVIRLGEGRGRNWWGLIDPDTALMMAAVSREDASSYPGSSTREDTEDSEDTENTEKKAVRWDWSWRALLSALFGLPMTAP
ncbi:MAG: stage II sporulation protein R [Clostridia bacterium]|nr:stage II sporulation protein R [Clostridia bacterium]